MEYGRLRTSELSEGIFPAHRLNFFKNKNKLNLPLQFPSGLCIKGCCMCTEFHHSTHHHNMLTLYLNHRCRVKIQNTNFILPSCWHFGRTENFTQQQGNASQQSSSFTEHKSNQITSSQLIIDDIRQLVSHHSKVLTSTFSLRQVMWVCNLCRKQQEILTKSGAWFYGSGPGQVRGVFEGGPQGKKAKLQDPSLYPYQGTSGDLTPASDRSRPHGGLLPRQASLDNGSGLRYPAPGDTPIDRSVLQLLHSTKLFLWLC